MEKKFALLTAQMKSEKRFSRRMEYRRSITVSAGTQQLHHNGASSTLSTQETLQNVSATASFPAPQHHSVYSYNGNRHGIAIGQRKSLGHFHNPATGLVVDGGILRGGQMATSSARVPIVVQRHSASCRYRERSRGQPGADINPIQCNNSKQVISVIESQELGNPASDIVKNEATNIVDSSNNTNVHLLSATSGPSLQSFPLDETCVYSNHQPLVGEINIPSSQFVVSSSTTLQTTSSASSTASSSPRIAGQNPENREASPHGSQQHRHRRTQGVPPPNVPRRTVSRLTSAEIGNNSTTTSPSMSSPESSSTIITLTSGTKPQQPKQSP